MLIYKEVVNRFFTIKLEQIEEKNIFIDKFPVSRNQAISLLSKYFQQLAEIAFTSIPEKRSIDFIHSVIKYLATNFSVSSIDCLNLNDVSDLILSSVINLTPLTIEKYLRSIHPFPAKYKGLSFKTDSPCLEIEILCSDRIDLMISSMKINITNKILKEYYISGKELRIVTDSDKVLDTFPNARCKISSGVSDSANLFLFRNSGFHIAYIGLFQQIGVKSLLWNFRATKYDNPDIINSISNIFYGL